MFTIFLKRDSECIEEKKTYLVFLTIGALQDTSSVLKIVDEIADIFVAIGIHKNTLSVHFAVEPRPVVIRPVGIVVDAFSMGIAVDPFAFVPL